MRRRLTGVSVAAFVLVLTGCASGLQPATSAPALTPSAPTTTAPTTPAPSPAASRPGLTPDTSDFAQSVTVAIAAAQLVPLVGLPSSTTARPDCYRIAAGATEPPTRTCFASFPASEPVVMITATSSGSAGGSHWMMVYAEMPDGIEATVLSAPKLGDEARLSRTWGALGCSAVLAVRKGTLVVSARVLLTRGASTADCGAPPPTEYLKTVARGLIDALAPTFASVGLPVDDPAARQRAVQLIVSGKLVPSDSDLVALPPDLALLSDTGEVIARHDGADWTIVFFEFRGVVDHYSGWVFVSDGKLGADEDPLGGGSALVKRIDAHWFHVVTN